MSAVPMPTGPHPEIDRILRTKYAIFTGGHDREHRSLITFPDLGMDSLPDESFSLLRDYFSALPSVHSSLKAFVVLIDRRSSDWSSVQTLLSQLKAFTPYNLRQIYVLKPQGFFQRFFVSNTMLAIREKCPIPIKFFDRVTDLSQFIDSEHLPEDVGGELSFNLEDWIRDQSSIGNFKAKVDNLCSLGHDLLTQLEAIQANHFDAIPTESDQHMVELNPCCLPSIEAELAANGRQFLNAIGALESEGLKLRQKLREPIEDSSEVCTEANGVELGAQAGRPACRLPVDRVFHVINLEHILVRLTEIRSIYTTRWNEYTKLVHVVRAIAELQNRCSELQSVFGIWENLMEATKDYGPARSIKSSNSFESDTQSPCDQSPSTTNTECDNPEATDNMFLEDLEAILGRLREAEQLGTHLLPELQSLFSTAEQLCTHSEEHSGVFQISLRDGCSLFAPLIAGTSEDANVESADLDFPSTLVRLPSEVTGWPGLLNELLEMAKTGLPKAVDQLSRVHELHSEIVRARDWLCRGSLLIASLIPSEDKIKQLSLSESRAHLDELITFTASREKTVKVLTDPKQFRQRFAGIVNSEMHMTLRDLLKNVEDVQCSSDALIASLRQHISRSTFPRHNLPSQSSNQADVKPSQPDLDDLHVGDDPEHTSLQESSEEISSATKRLQLAWEELLDTERSYVNFLKHVYDVVQTIPCPFTEGSESGQRDIPNLLLGNWGDLLFFHRDHLLPNLESCGTSASKLAQWARQVVPHLIDLYSVYCSVHPNALHVAGQLERDRQYAAWMSACSEEVCRREGTTKDKLSRPVLKLTARLVSPVQRFQRYHLLVGQLLRLALTETDKTDFSKAHKTMLEMCESINLTMRLRCLSVRPSELGSLLLRADFTVYRDDSRSAKQRHVFLFQNALLLTKLRVSGSSLPLHKSCSVTESGRDRSSSSGSLSNVPLASNLANLVKSYTVLGVGNVIPGSALDTGPVYEIREELLLVRIGLTPSMKSDRRRFAIWTANRAQTYVFQSTDQATRDQWVRKINDLLLDQLLRLRAEAQQRQGSKRKPVANSTDQNDRSSSLPVSKNVELLRSSDRDNGSVLSLPNPSTHPDGEQNA